MPKYKWSLLFFFTISCLSHASTSQYEWKPVEKSGSSGGVSATGRVVPQDGALNIESARVQGRVLGILRREGETVTAGTPIYSVSSTECLTLVEERKIATSKKLSELLEGLARREKQLGLRLHGEECAVVASNSGVLTKRSLESGASFNVGDVMATVLDTKKLTVELDLPERDQSRVRTGQRVSLQFASNPGETFSTKIQTIVPTIDPTTRTSKARLASIRLPKNLSLDALVFGVVNVDHQEASLKIPSSALVFSNGQQYVVTGTDEKPRAVPVLVINENDSQSTIRPKVAGALKEGDLAASRGAIYLLKKITLDVLP